MNLTTTLAIAFFSLSAVVLLLSGSLQILSNLQAQQAIVFNQQQLIAQDASATVRNFIQENLNTLQTTIRLANVTAAAPDAQAQTLQTMLGLQPAFRQAALYDAQQHELARASRLSQTATQLFLDRISADVLAELEQGNTYIGQVYFDAATSEPLILMAVPLSNVFGDFEGSVVAEVNLKFMWDLVDQLSVGQTGLAYVVDSQGQLIAFRDTARVLRGENVAGLPVVQEFVANPAVSAAQDSANVYDGIDGTLSVTTFAGLGTPDWAVVTELPVREAFDSVLRGAAVSAVVIFVMAALAGVGGSYIARRLSVPLRNLTDTAVRIAEGELTLEAQVSGTQEVVRLADAFNSMTTQLRQLIDNLELRVQDRTAALATSTDVSRGLTAILDESELVGAVVQQVRDAFGYYHVHIYLHDETIDRLVMAGGTGDAGRQMLAQGHAIEPGLGLVGRAAITKAPVFVPDVSEDAHWLPNPLLPETRTEAAVPIIAAGRTLGVLDVQHNVAGGLTAESVELLQAIANQVAVALQNARQVRQTQESEARTRAVLESVTVPLLISRVGDGQMLYVNDQLADVVRMPIAALRQSGTPNFYVDMADRRTVVGQIQQQGAVTNYELRLQRADGEQFWALLSARLIQFAGDPAIITTLIDITDRKQTEATLARQATALAAVAEVSTAAATILQPDQLLQAVVDLTKDRFALYHAHVFLLDADQETLRLTAGAGSVGRQMVAEGRRIPLAAPGSLVATAARQQQATIRSYDTAGEGFMPHPLLLDTRSEMAVPIILGETLLGVLDVRAVELNYFDDADKQTFTSLAAQVAVALQNARSFAQAEAAVNRLNLLTRRLTREGWQDALHMRHAAQLAYAYAPAAQAAERPSTPEPAAPTLVQPLQVQGEQIGALALTDPAQLPAEAEEILTAVSARLTTHIENLRLSAQTAQALAATESLYAASSQIIRAESIADVLTAVTENTRLNQFALTTIQLFDKPWDNTPPNAVILAAAHGPAATMPLRSVLPLSAMPVQALMKRDEVTIAEDLRTDPRINEETRHFLVDQLHFLSAIFFPLVAGDQWYGVLIANHTAPIEISPDEKRQFTSLINQAAVVIQSLRLFADAESRARREQLLRQVTDRIYAAPDAASLLQATAREVQRVLGKDAFVYLESPQDHAPIEHPAAAPQNGRRS
ncbi:MAG: GAF domain-containing protein [Anaerolineales bacterium]|nr:GAF domain-containing protein [Anaerolineales bacterium]